MNYYFSDPEKDAELKIILEEWLDTPFKHKCAVKKLGCDCVHFVIKVFEEMELIELKNGMIPDYPPDWHMHNTREILKEGILKYLKVKNIDIDSIYLNGDIVLSHYGKASSHVGIKYGKHIYQALTKIGVKKIHIDDPAFKKQIKFIYRILF